MSAASLALAGRQHPAPADGCECAACRDAEQAGIRAAAGGAPFCMGDDSGGPIEPLAATALDKAVAEAKESVMDTAMDEASAYGSTALQDFVVYSRRDDGGYDRESSGTVQADPDPPKCTDGTRKHAWRNPDPEWSGYGNALGGGVTVVRDCPECGAVRTVKTGQSDNFANAYDSVAYEVGEASNVACDGGECDDGEEDGCEDAASGECCA